MPTRQRSLFGMMAPLVMLLSGGCEHNDFILQLTPQGPGFARELTCWRHDPDKDGNPTLQFNAEELGRLATTYRVPAPEPASRRFTFRAEFQALPQDLGGAGHYLHWSTALGHATWYDERFRGTDLLVPRLEARQRATDRLVEIIDGWLKTMLEGEPEWARLHAFLTGPGQDDLRNVALYLWVGRIAEEISPAPSSPLCCSQERVAESATAPAPAAAAATSGTPGPVPPQPEAPSLHTDMIVRAAQFLAEHGYLRPEQLPDLLQAFEDGTGGNLPRSSWRLLGDILARKLGVPADSRLIQSFLAAVASDGAPRSFGVYLQSLPEWDAMLQEWEARPERQPGEARPDPTKIIDELLGQAFTGSAGPAAKDQLALHLKTGVRPHATNGTWQAESGEVRWRLALPGDDEMPAFAFAGWAQPDEARQTQYFGQVLLRDGALAQYALWQAGLTADETAQWEGFLAQLKPGTDHVTAIRAFALCPTGAAAPPPSAAARDADRLATGKRLLCEALQKDTPTTAAPAP